MFGGKGGYQVWRVMEFPGSCLGCIRQVVPRSCRGWGVGCLRHRGVGQSFLYPWAKLYDV